MPQMGHLGTTQKRARAAAAATPYKQLHARVPENPTVQGLSKEFLRDELRSLLKANRVSYHKVGPQNLMKSKAEMAEDLLGLIRSGRLSDQPAAEDDDGHHAKKKQRKKPAPQKQPQPQPQRNANLMQHPQVQQLPMQHPPIQHSQVRVDSWLRETYAPPPPPPVHQSPHAGLTPRTRAAAEIIATFPPASPRARQKILKLSNTEEEEDAEEVEEFVACLKKASGTESPTGVGNGNGFFGIGPGDWGHKINYQVTAC